MLTRLGGEGSACRHGPVMELCQAFLKDCFQPQLTNLVIPTPLLVDLWSTPSRTLNGACNRCRDGSTCRKKDGVHRRADWVAALERSAGLPKTSYNDYLHIDPLLALQVAFCTSHDACCMHGVRCTPRATIA
jgi:hypothetical protein